MIDQYTDFDSCPIFDEYSSNQHDLSLDEDKFKSFPTLSSTFSTPQYHYLEGVGSSFNEETVDFVMDGCLIEQISECMELIFYEYSNDETYLHPIKNEVFGVLFSLKQGLALEIHIGTLILNLDVHDHDYIYDMRCDSNLIV